MKSLLAFIKKETMEQFRSGRLMILGILFVLLGGKRYDCHACNCKRNGFLGAIL